jgi:hypothetical protein
VARYLLLGAELQFSLKQNWSVYRATTDPCNQRRRPFAANDFRGLKVITPFAVEQCALSLKQEKETVQSALTNRNKRMGGHGIAGIGDGRITADGRHTPAAIAMDGDNGLFRLGVD